LLIKLVNILTFFLTVELCVYSMANMRNANNYFNRAAKGKGRGRLANTMGMYLAFGLR